jgi:hypothetical protein
MQALVICSSIFGVFLSFLAARKRASNVGMQKARAGLKEKKKRGK